ncbi:hypothetical protein A2955_03990 [Candidatus Woesebacteria bacterium RIFCSPLOWO2_01_FULL_37_19]|uniref:Uncharacterized protein n=2 Tax=Candidatus Woeseibacteriota TaxID=1752722 RepID=A0A1F8B7D5_9BACT|nr:MAG: hypothetical protein A2771_03620 [Candidatus Woesebacteria bacterium RIFCSPHIGHO2_01_FULL_38_26b]OGM59943.1 MAG: hypothetical protein A2955_03990 [Candidatus Woesebacteria bacterium RIFCSPLOWO2_01_FULL_37_19]
MDKLSYDFSLFCIKTLKLGKKCTVLDIGGRYPADHPTYDKHQGSFSYHFRHLFRSTFAVDIENDGGNVDLVIDAEDLLYHFPKKSFDIIVCQSTIENFQEKLAKKIPFIISTLLKDGGYIILSGETQQYYIKYDYAKTDRRFRHYQFTKKGIINLFSKFNLIFPQKYNRYKGIWQCYGHKKQT